MMLALSATIAVALDWLLGEPRRFHPLVGFGNLASRIENLCHAARASARAQNTRGVVAVLLALVPLTALTALLASLPYLGTVFSILALYFAVGHRSLHDHARPVATALHAQQHRDAQQLASRMVSRDVEAIVPEQATVESVLENGNDGVFGALFWFAVAGAPGAVLYRMANTLDAMWGYRNERYLHFGWAAARLDDALNYLPARLTALTYALLGKTHLALACWREQAPRWDSPNAGPVMAAGAGALGVQLGGAARYENEWHDRPALGRGEKPAADDIERALKLVRHGVLLWLGALFAMEALAYA